MPHTTVSRQRRRSLHPSAVVWCLPILSALLGCGVESSKLGSAVKSEITDARVEAPPPAAFEAPGMMAGEAAPMSPPGEDQAIPGNPFAGEGPAPAAPGGVARKIIYNADLALVVEDFAKVEPEVTRLVQTHQGYIANQEVLGSPGERRSARWTLRVPVDSFETFLQEVARLGELERNTRTSQDVSEQFYDIEARVKNKQVEEAQLLKLLEERTGQLEDVLKVEAELSRVRGEIEQMQGRLRVLTNLTSLTTVTLSVREREKFQPAPPVVASFPTRVSRTFQESLSGLVELGENVILFATNWILWVPILLLELLVFWLVARGFVWVLSRGGRRLWKIARTPTGPPPSS